VAERLVRRQPRLLPAGDHEPAASDSPTPEEEEGLAQMALLSGVPAKNSSIVAFVRGLTNQQIAQYLQQTQGA
jgi:hypothetical protein